MPNQAFEQPLPVRQVNNVISSGRGLAFTKAVRGRLTGSQWVTNVAGRLADFEILHPQSSSEGDVRWLAGGGCLMFIRI